ncbi:putative chaperone protein HSP31 [Hyaloscypha variabilis F]|uniref:D-lactate dehydratase n=1 Tax=Hyaloscypha variabilis (strain UAMH 11265 / GT02V1 / F) TaxID=1149755 RepID=A0A2J6SA94_HYAVF|nr:putative chaperone protein HSP31 [Hyaloscypha variabilis F]
MATKNVLIVLSSHDLLGSTGRPTGWYLPEFAHPYYVLAPHVKLTIASPKGGHAPLDPGSVEAFKADPESVEFVQTKSALWENTEKLSTFLGRAKEFDAIFYPGGHGPMYDLATDPDSIALIREFWEAGKIVSTVCHGAAALTHATLSDGSYLVADTPVTGFANAEEDAIDFSQYMPFMLETELNKISGGKYEKAAEDWASHVVVAKEDRLLTGQNPGSARDLAVVILEKLNA